MPRRLPTRQPSIHSGQNTRAKVERQRLWHAGRPPSPAPTLNQITPRMGIPNDSTRAKTALAFLTAYQDRDSAGFKKTVAALAWGSFAWFVSEPSQIIILRDGASSTASL